MRSESEINYAINQYSDMIQRICFYHLRNQADTEDIFQNVFLKYLLYEGTFESPEHEKAWLIRVSINACKDHLRYLFRHPTLPLDILSEQHIYTDSEHYDVLNAVLELPSKYKDVIYLYYYEQYSASEISKILHKKENTIYSLLSRGRSILKKELGGEDFV